MLITVLVLATTATAAPMPTADALITQAQRAMSGIDRPSDFLKGDGLLAAAAKLGSARATALRGITRLHAEPPRVQEGLMYLRAAWQANEPDAQAYMAALQARGLHVRAEPKRAMNDLTVLANAGHARAMYELGRLYAEGILVERSDLTAAKWYAAGAERGSMEAGRDLGALCIARELQGCDVPKTVALLQRAMNAGSGRAGVTLARLYTLRGQRPSAVKLLQRLVPGGNVEAVTLMAHAYQQGRDVPKDLNRAEQYYTWSVARGDATAGMQLALMYLTDARPNNDAKGAALLQAAQRVGMRTTLPAAVTTRLKTLPGAAVRQAGTYSFTRSTLL